MARLLPAVSAREERRWRGDMKLVACEIRRRDG